MDQPPRPQVDTRFYGRRRGKPLKPAQQALLESLYPRLRLDLPAAGDAFPADLRSLFPAPVRAVWLEIGFGGGEHLVHQARTHPDVGFIGAEPFLNGLGKLLRQVEDTGLGDSLRIFGEDVRPLLDALPAASLERIFLLFPDPWPKARHAQRRFINPDNLNRLARLLVEGGRLRVASDDMGYIRWTLRQVPDHPAFAWTARGPEDWRTRWADACPTRYEMKAGRAGRTPKYLEFIRK